MKISAEPFRRSSATYMGIDLPEDAAGNSQGPESVSDIRSDLPILDAADPLLLTVKSLMEDGFAGVILSGQPGTSKTYFARRLAATLCGQMDERISFVQFHPSYQYEDFIETYQPTDSGGFSPKARIFLEMCEAARGSPHQHVLVIDELSRSDAVRVFGEALTYLEASQRDIQFELASGRKVSIPKNLFIVATMNPWDRGVDELDMAFERRFAKIEMQPSVEHLTNMLSANGLQADLTDKIVAFFRRVQSLNAIHARIGHAYFSRVNNLEGLNRLWEYQLSHHFKRAFKLVPQDFDALKQAWDQVVSPPISGQTAPVAQPAVAAVTVESENENPT